MRTALLFVVVLVAILFGSVRAADNTTSFVVFNDVTSADVTNIPGDVKTVASDFECRQYCRSVPDCHQYLLQISSKQCQLASAYSAFYYSTSDTPIYYFGIGDGGTCAQNGGSPDECTDYPGATANHGPERRSDRLVRARRTEFQRRLDAMRARITRQRR